jgi:hypothetical protein
MDQRYGMTLGGNIHRTPPHSKQQRAASPPSRWAESWQAAGEAVSLNPRSSLFRLSGDGAGFSGPRAADHASFPRWVWPSKFDRLGFGWAAWRDD